MVSEATDHPSAGETTRTDAARRGWLAGVALVVTLAGPALYLGFLDVPWVRSTGLPGFVLLPLGFLLGVRAAVADRRWWVRLGAGLEFLMLAGFALGLTVLTRVPAAEGFARLTWAPDFTVADHEGRPFHLADELKASPVLIVFYRGYW